MKLVFGGLVRFSFFFQLLGCAASLFLASTGGFPPLLSSSDCRSTSMCE